MLTEMLTGLGAPVHRMSCMINSRLSADSGSAPEYSGREAQSLIELAAVISTPSIGFRSVLKRTPLTVRSASPKTSTATMTRSG